MNDRLLRLYHRLPPPARSAAATIRGLYLRLWRESGRREALEQAALERERWSADRWRAWRDERLAFLLHRAATCVPYYRERWAARRARGDRSSWERLEHWPVLEKGDVRANPRAFLAGDCSPRRMYHDHTSGTTGSPLRTWAPRAAVETLYAIAGARTLGWHGIPATARYARLGGQLVTPVHQRRPPFWVWNAAMRQLYLSSHHLAPRLVPYYLDALSRYRVVYLAGYPSSLAVLAQEAIRLGRRDLRMAAAFTNAEPLRPEQREVIAEAFQCPVRETYGMAEAVAAASECPEGRLHQWPEVGYVEVWAEDGPAPPGGSGELLCTGLLNPDMPLIRYRVGDRARLAPEGSACACGRSLPVVAAIDGRASDMLLTADGRRVFWLNPVFYGLPVRESQIVQEALGRVRVLVAPATGFAPATTRTIVERLRARLGETIEVRVEQVERVPRTAAGKVRAVVCEIGPDEREAVLARAAAPVP